MLNLVYFLFMVDLAWYFNPFHSEYIYIGQIKLGKVVRVNPWSTQQEQADNAMTHSIFFIIKVVEG